MITNEQFEKMLEEEYKGVDWDNIPSEENLPDVWMVSGEYHTRTLHKKTMKESRSISKFTIEKDYENEEEAQNQIKEMLHPDSNWMKEKLIKTISGKYVEEFHGPLVEESLNIKKVKQSKGLDLLMMKELREDYLNKKISFPIYLP